MAITKTYSDGGSGKHCKLEPLFIAPLFSFYFTDDEKTSLAAPNIDIFKLYPNASLQELGVYIRAPNNEGGS